MKLNLEEFSSLNERFDEIDIDDLIDILKDNDCLDDFDEESAENYDAYISYVDLKNEVVGINFQVEYPDTGEFTDTFEIPVSSFLD